MKTSDQIRRRARWAFALVVLVFAAVLVGSASAVPPTNQIGVRAVIPNGDQIAVTFEGDAAGPAADIKRYTSSDCTTGFAKGVPSDVTTIATTPPPAQYQQVGDGIITIVGGSIGMLAPSPVVIGTIEYVFSFWSADENGTLQTPPTTNPACFNTFITTGQTNVTAHYIVCSDCEDAPPLSADENVTVDFNQQPVTCDDGTTDDLCLYFDQAASEATRLANPGDASQWKAIFDVGGRFLIIQNNVTVTTVNVPSSGNNQKAPGIVIKGTCQFRIDPGGRVLVRSVNQQAGDILIQFDSNIFIGGTVRDEVTGTNGKPGEITIASCCGDITTGPTSRIETIGVDPGGSDINILTCCARGGELADGGDIEINGLVLAQHKYGTTPTINVVSFVGEVTINGTNQFGLETVNGFQFNRTSGLLVYTANATDGGDINVQALLGVTVLGNKQFLVPNRVNFGAIAIKTNNTNGQGGNGKINVRAVGDDSEINATDRSFDLENRFNHTGNTAINLSADGDINLNDGGIGANFVVSSQGGSGGQGGTNTIQSCDGLVTVGANAEVLANAPGGATGINILKGFTPPGVVRTGTVDPIDSLLDDTAGCTSPLVPNFASCERNFSVFFDHDNGNGNNHD